MTKKISIGIIGCGRVALHYYNILKKIDKKLYNITCISDKNSKKLSNFSKRFNCRYYKNFKKMIEKENLNLVFVLTPSGNHYEIVKYLINKKINILCEKPLTMVPNQSLELFRLSKKNKVMLCVAYQNRLNPAVKFLKESIKKKKFGKVIKASVSILWCRRQNYYNDEWHGTWKMDGGVVNQQAIHYIDILRWVFGPVKEVFCYMGNRLNKLEAEDTAVAAIKFKNGALGTVEATTAARPIDIHASLSLVGSKGTIVLGGLALNKITRIIGLKNSKSIIKKYSQEFKNGYGISHLPLIKAVIKNLRNKKIISPINAVESFKTTQLIHAMYSSNEKKRSVLINKNVRSLKLGK